MLTLILYLLLSIIFFLIFATKFAPYKNSEIVVKLLIIIISAPIVYYIRLYLLTYFKSLGLDFNVLLNFMDSINMIPHNIGSEPVDLLGIAFYLSSSGPRTPNNVNILNPASSGPRIPNNVNILNPASSGPRIPNNNTSNPVTGTRRGFRNPNNINILNPVTESNPVLSIANILNPVTESSPSPEPSPSPESVNAPSIASQLTGVLNPIVESVIVWPAFRLSDANVKGQLDIHQTFLYKTGKILPADYKERSLNASDTKAVNWLEARKARTITDREGQVLPEYTNTSNGVIVPWLSMYKCVDGYIFTEQEYNNWISSNKTRL